MARGTVEIGFIAANKSQFDVRQWGWGGRRERVCVSEMEKKSVTVFE
jgi:hypothetical protein